MSSNILPPIVVAADVMHEAVMPSGSFLNQLVVMMLFDLEMFPPSLDLGSEGSVAVLWLSSETDC